VFVHESQLELSPLECVLHSPHDNPPQVDEPQYVLTSVTHCESQAVLQQYESCEQTADVHESHDDFSAPEWVVHSPQEFEPESLPESVEPSDASLPASLEPSDVASLPASVPASVPASAEHVEDPQYVGTSETQVESQAVLQQYESWEQTALVHESQVEVSAEECVVHSPHDVPVPASLLLTHTFDELHV
jgi:hypothetical protein